MSIDKTKQFVVAEKFSHFVGQILTSIESTPISEERQERLKRLVERTIYDTRNMVMNGANASEVIPNMRERIETIGALALFPKELAVLFNNALALYVADLTSALE